MTRQRFLSSRLGSPSWMGTSSASSPTLSGPRTGAATTTSPKRRWPRWPSNRTGYPSWIVVGAGTGGTAAAYAQPGSLRSSFNRHQRLRCPALACETHADQTAGTIVTLMCDSGARYTTTYDDDIWLKDMESTSALTCPWSNGPGKTRSVMARTRFDVACPLSVSVLS